jgi:hypothetical protein
MSKLSYKLSKAANLFEISTWYFSLISTSLSFFSSNLSKSKFCLTHFVRVIKLRRMRWACMEVGRGVYRVLVGRPEGKRPLGRSRCKWEDNIKLDLRELGIDGTNWIWLAQYRVLWWAFVSLVMNLWVP